MQTQDVQGRFGHIVRTRRNQLGFSQEELAGRAGLHRTYIADIERGARNVSLQSIDKLAVALEVSLAALFEQISGQASGAGARAFVDILLVEDDQDDVQLTLLAFERAKIQNRVRVIRDGRSAIEYLLGGKVEADGAQAAGGERSQPQLVLLDLHLPHVGGIEVLRRLKTDERTRTIPVVILTSSAEDRHVEECRRLGAATYIVKPVNFEALCRVTPELRLSWALLKGE